MVDTGNCLEGPQQWQDEGTELDEDFVCLNCW